MEILNLKTERITTMIEKRVEQCHCDKCGNEAEMTITCQLVEVQEPTGETKKQKRENRVCKVCGNEANMIIDFDD